MSHPKILFTITDIQKIDWNDRRGESSFFGCWCSVDGTDKRIEEPTQFDRHWYSHKFKSAGVRYEVAISIDHGRIVWVNGPFRSGQYPDIKIFRSKLKLALDNNEHIVADNGYKDERCILANDIPAQWRSVHSKIRARHECINRPFKQFACLTTTFRHNITKHGHVFHAVANLTHLQMEVADELFQVDFE